MGPVCLWRRAGSGKQRLHAARTALSANPVFCRVFMPTQSQTFGHMLQRRMLGGKESEKKTQRIRVFILVMTTRDTGDWAALSWRDALKDVEAATSILYLLTVWNKDTECWIQRRQKVETCVQGFPLGIKTERQGTECVFSFQLHFFICWTVKSLRNNADKQLKDSYMMWYTV